MVHQPSHQSDDSFNPTRLQPPSSPSPAPSTEDKGSSGRTDPSQYPLKAEWDLETDSSSVHRYAFGRDPAWGARRLRQSTVRWLPEIASCVASFACVAVIVAVLKSYDGQPMPQWPLGITLNAFLAFFTSVAKLAMLIPVVEGLGQLRWLWFARKARKLADFELFEQACRGAYGSIKLLFSLKGGILGFLAALVMVSSLMTSPITQQIIRFPTRLDASTGAAYVPTVTHFLRNEEDEASESAQTAPHPTVEANKLTPSGSVDYMRKLKQNILFGACTSPKTTVKNDAPSCTSADCAFPEFASLSVCSRVANVSSHLVVERLPDRDWNYVGLADNTTWRVRLPGNFTAGTVVPNIRFIDFVVMREWDQAANSLAFDAELLRTAMADVFLVYANEPDAGAGNSVSFHALEILFYWCVRSYGVRVQDGQAVWEETAPPSRTVLDSNATTLDGVFASMDHLIQAGLGPPIAMPPSANRTLLTLAAPPRSLPSPSPSPSSPLASPTSSPLYRQPVSIDEITALTVSAVMQTSFWNGVNAPPMLTRFMTLQSGGGGNSSSVPLSSAGLPSNTDGGMVLIGHDALYREQGDAGLAFAGTLWPSIFHDVNLDPAVQADAVANLTRNMAKGIENFIRQVNPSTLSMISGTVLSPTPYVSIRWPYLLFLLIELLSATVFLASVVLATRRARMQVIKGSSLGAMCALDGLARRRLGSIDDCEGLNRRARHMDVRLQRGVSGVAMWLAMEEAQERKGGAKEGSDEGARGRRRRLKFWR